MKAGGGSGWYGHCGERMDAEYNIDLALGEPGTRSRDRHQTRPDEWGIDVPLAVATRDSASMRSPQSAYYPGLHPRRKRRSLTMLAEYSHHISFGARRCPKPLYDTELAQDRPTTNTSASAQRTDYIGTSLSPVQAH